MDLAVFACVLDLRPMDFGVSAVYKVQLFAEGFRFAAGGGSGLQFVCVVGVWIS